jgi:hypothetical protein
LLIYSYGSTIITNNPEGAVSPFTAAAPVPAEFL